MGTFERPTQECLAVAAVYFVFVGLAVTVWQSRFAGHGLLAMGCQRAASHRWLSELAHRSQLAST